MNGPVFIHRARKWAKRQQTSFDGGKGSAKGGHQIVRLGARWTTVKTSEIGTGLLVAMLKQLGIPKDEF